MFRSINKIIKIIIYWDFFINSAWGLLGPVFAIFIVQNIAVGETAEGAKIAGFAALFYWVVKSILQIPFGKYLDKNHGEKDDFVFMILGTFLTGLVPFGFLISYLPWHIYIFQILHALGMAMVVPSSYAIFTRHIDKGKEAFEWGLDSTILGVGVGVTGAIGGVMAAYFGFKTIFILTGIFTIISAFLIFLIRKEIHPKDQITHKIPPSRPL
jgi:MFS family permease